MRIIFPATMSSATCSCWTCITNFSRLMFKPKVAETFQTGWVNPYQMLNRSSLSLDNSPFFRSVCLRPENFLNCESLQDLVSSTELSSFSLTHLRSLSSLITSCKVKEGRVIVPLLLKMVWWMPVFLCFSMIMTNHAKFSFVILSDDW